MEFRLLRYHAALAIGQSQIWPHKVKCQPARLHLNLVSKTNSGQNPWVLGPLVSSPLTDLSEHLSSSPGKQGSWLEIHRTPSCKRLSSQDSFSTCRMGSTRWRHALHEGGSGFGNKYKHNLKEWTFKEETDMIQARWCQERELKEVLTLKGVDQMKTTRP